ncbi:MAG: hypothetical protein QXG91_04525 [Candidatus Aenigmatarchaeota archaeon]
MSDEIRDKVKRIYKVIAENLYVCEPDERFDNTNPTLLLSILTCLLNGKELIFGNVGIGKTTSVESIVSLMYGIPLEVILSSEAHGDPEVTKEEYVAQPDLSNMKDIIWRRFVQFPLKIFDEFNRLPPSKQNLFLDGIDRGNFEYMNQTLFSEPGPLFATCNYADMGTTELNWPMRDRFDVAVVAQAPHPLLRRMIAYRKIDEEILKDKEFTKRMLAILDSKEEYYDKKINELYQLAEKFKGELKEKLKEHYPDFKPLSRDELSTVNREILNIRFSKEAELFLDFIHAEFQCPYCGEKIPGESEICHEGCHYSKIDIEKGYAFRKVKRGLSVRFDKSLRKYAQALAWYFSDEEVKSSHIEIVFPYVLWHRMEFTEEYKNMHRSDTKGEPLNLYLSKQLISEISKRFDEQKAIIVDAYQNYLDGDPIKEKTDHPIFVYFESLLKWI